MLVRAIAANKRWDKPLLVGSLCLPVGAYALCQSIPQLDFMESISEGRSPGYGIVIMLMAVTISVVILLLLRESRSVRKWESQAEQVTINTDEVLLQSWAKPRLWLFGIAMGGFIIWQPLPEYPYLWRVIGVVFVLASVGAFLIRSRHSPWGVPEVEITGKAMRLANPSFRSCDGTESMPYQHGERKKYIGVFSIALRDITEINWISTGTGQGQPQLLIKANAFTVTHPITKKPPYQSEGRGYTIQAALSAGEIPPDAIVAFAEKVIPQSKRVPDIEGNTSR